jgi:hypothetical protein
VLQQKVKWGGGGGPRPSTLRSSVTGGLAPIRRLGDWLMLGPRSEFVGLMQKSAHSLMEMHPISMGCSLSHFDTYMPSSVHSWIIYSTITLVCQY